MADWPVGQFVVPSGTLLTTNYEAGDWNGMRLPALPMCVEALDQTSADALSRWFPDHLSELRAQPPARIRKLINVG
jgi:hypothetical protein